MLVGDDVIVVTGTMVRQLGWVRAIVLQRVYYWLQHPHVGKGIDGYRWVYISQKEWLRQIPVKERTLQRALRDLEADELLMVREGDEESRFARYYRLGPAVDDLLEGRLAPRGSSID